MESHFSSCLCNKTLHTKFLALTWNCEQIDIKRLFTVWYIGKKQLLLEKKSMFLVLKSQNLVWLVWLILTPTEVTSSFILMLTHMHLINVCKKNVTINKAKQANRWGQLNHLVKNRNENTMKYIFIFSVHFHIFNGSS